MGVYIEVISEHALGLNPLTDLTNTFAPLVATISRHEALWCHWSPKPVHSPFRSNAKPGYEWVGSFHEADGLAVLEATGPFGIGIRILPSLCILRPTPKWAAFVSDPHTIVAVTELCEAMARCIGATKLIYLPDSAYGPSRAIDLLDQEVPLDAIADWLEIECGPPAQDIASIHRLLTDDEMRRHIPAWNEESEGRLSNADGYFIASVP